MGSANSKGKKKSQPKNSSNTRQQSEGNIKATTKGPNTSKHEEENDNPTTDKNHKPDTNDDTTNRKSGQKHDDDDDDNNNEADDEPLKNLKRLQAACQKENLTAVKTLTKKQKVSVTEPDPSSGKVALHYCVSNKETETAQAVLDTDASCLNLKDDAGFTALLLASVAGNLKMVKFLRERGSSVRTADNEGHSACHWAAVCGHEEVLEYLQGSGADLSAMDKNGATPLHYAVHGNDDVTQAKSLKMTRMLLEKGVKVDAVDEDGRTPLLWAASSGREKICKVLLDSGADVEAFDQDKLTGLHSAAAKGHPYCIEILLEREAKIEATDKNGCTPLFYAIHQSEMDCAKLLLQKKANPNHCDVKGRSVSHCAAATGNLEAMKLLKQHKADLWIKSKETGDLPIHEAAMAGHTEVVQFLMEGLDSKTNAKDAINRGNAKGKTCLHMAALSNNLPLCKYLVKNGADVNAPMKHESGELLPYDCAVLKNNNECAKYLKQNGARSSKDEGKAAAPKPVAKQDTKSSDKKSEEDKKAPETRRNPVQTKEMSCQTEKDADKKELVNNESQTIQPSKKAIDKAVQSPMKPSPSVDRENGRLTDRGTQTTDTKSTPPNGKKEASGKAKPTKDNQGNDSPKKDISPSKAKKEKSPAKENKDKDADSDKYSSDEREDSGTYSEDEKQNNKKGKVEDNDKKKKQQPKQEHQQKTNRNPSKPPERSYIEARRLVNLNVHPTIIREQVRAYETKRLAAMKLNHSNRMKMNGKGFSEERLVRKLARDYNEDARTEDRIPSGHFKTLKDFDNFLRGEINIADVDEKRLRKLEKVKPIYYITF